MSNYKILNYKATLSILNTKIFYQTWKIDWSYTNISRNLFAKSLNYMNKKSKIYTHSLKTNLLKSKRNHWLIP